MRIQERDKELLHLLHRYGLLETRHIHAKCFRGIAPTTMYRRLRKLEKDELICRSVGLRNGIAAYYLGKAGATAIGQDVLARFTNRNAFEHELAITDFRMALESIDMCKEFISERQVRKNFQWTRSSSHRDQVIPDGILIEEVQGKLSTIALEMELNLKCAKRYKGVFEEYRYMRSVDYVWYVVSDLSIKESITKAWLDVQMFDYSPQLIITEQSDIIQKPANAMIHFVDCSSTKLSDFYGSKSVEAKPLNESENLAQCVSTLNDENTA